MSEATLTKIKTKIETLEQRHGWKCLGFGHDEDKGGYFVEWDLPEYKHPYRADFEHIQGLYAYPNDKLGTL